MTDSPTRTRGGRRPGAGRPKKDRSATTIQAADIQLLISDKAPNEVETAAQRHARMAVEVLVKKLKIGVNGIRSHHCREGNSRPWVRQAGCRRAARRPSDVAYWCRNEG